MTTLYYSHPACREHRPGHGHPERPERLDAIRDALDAEAFQALERREAPAAEVVQLARAHPPAFVERVIATIPEAGFVSLDADTTVSPGSGEAALRAAGAVCAAVDAVMAGEADTAFCAVRPPGHHAERETAMGFCIFNNVAVGAEQARKIHGLRRVAAIDFDVHHGNGTQDIFWNDPDLFYASTHQMPLYPGTGAARERGVAGNIVNVPLAPFTGGTEFRAAVEGIVMPALRRFAPEMIMISAGFDAHEDDPLANLSLTGEDYAWVTETLLTLAREICQGRVVSVLEGGYSLAALAEAVPAHVRALMAPR